MYPYTEVDRYQRQALEDFYSYKDPKAIHAPAYQRYIKAQAFRKRRINEYGGSHDWPDKVKHTYNKMMRGTWDGRVFFDLGKLKYPTGLVMLYNFANNQHIVTGKLDRVPFKKKLKPLPIELYDYQQLCVDMCGDDGLSMLDHPIKKGYDKPTAKRVEKFLLETRNIRFPLPFGLFLLATSAGKTEVLSGIIHNMKSKVLVTTPNRTAMENLAHRLKKYFRGLKICIFHGKVKHVPASADIVVTTLNTLMGRKPHNIAERIWIADECHREIKKQTQLALLYRPTFRYGLTATMPEGTAAKAKLIGLFGPVRGRETEGELQEKGVVAERRIFFIDNPQPSILYKNYTSGYFKNVVDNYVRNCIITDIAQNIAKYGKSSLVFVKRKAHARILYDLMEERGLRAEYVTGDDTTEDLKKCYDNLAHNRIDVLIGTPIVNTALNIPSLVCTIAAAGDKANTTRTQERGRSARKYGDQIKLHFDFMDNWRYKEIEKGKTEKSWAAKHSLRRRKSAEKEGNQVIKISEKDIDSEIRKVIVRTPQREIDEVNQVVQQCYLYL